jgi:L-seryl-tRNA(Ser) seleniumtransferase
VRQALEQARERLSRQGEDPEPLDRLAEEARRLAEGLARLRPGRVVNATGVVLHTNLGRAVLAPGAAAAAARAGTAYTDLELDRERGRRGDRLAGVTQKLRLLSEAEGALAVNNNAAALLLALHTLARGREVIVSRGELVEIGGSFRLPEIVEAAGVRLVEVGTTNRTHVHDYRRAVRPESAVLLKVHRSNFEQSGFVAEVALPELAQIAGEHGLPLVEDLGSGTLVDLRERGLPESCFAPARLRLGADLVCFSGDKLLGGPQAGIVLGRAELVQALRYNPLARALRLDKLSLAALDWTLAALLEERVEKIPLLQQLTEPPARLEARAHSLAKRLAAVSGSRLRISVERNRAAVGGGSLPGFELDSWAVVLQPSDSAEGLARGLREATPPVLARIREDRVLLDVRTLLPGDDEALERALAMALKGSR